MPVILYKMLVAEFKGKKYRLTDYGLKGISFDEYTYDSGFSPMDDEQIEKEFTEMERYYMELLFDQ